MIELLAVITILGIIAGIAVTSFQSVTNNAKKKTYQDFETSMESAANNYLMEYMEEIPDVESEIKISADTLVEKGFLETMADPDKNGSTCDHNSYVLVQRNAATGGGYNLNLKYTPCLVCSKYQSCH